MQYCRSLPVVAAKDFADPDPNLRNKEFRVQY